MSGWTDGANDWSNDDSWHGDGPHGDGPHPAGEPHEAAPAYEVVIPTVGRPSLTVLLASLAAAGEPQPSAVHVVEGRTRGPAAARNVGWRAAEAPWVVFLDDDVVVPPGWCRELAADLARIGPRAAGSQGRIRVPLAPADAGISRSGPNIVEKSRPWRHKSTKVGGEAGGSRSGAGGDWARNVAGLETAQWATADLAYRRRVLAAVGGFDERFPRAYREDADLGLRVVDAGWTIERGRRVVHHPVRPEHPWVSVRSQRGNADDALMRRLHGAGWQERAGAGRGRRPLHLAITAAWLLAAAGSAAARALTTPNSDTAGRIRPSHVRVPLVGGRVARTVAVVGLVIGAGLTAELFVHRLRGARRPPPGTPGGAGSGPGGWCPGRRPAGGTTHRPRPPCCSTGTARWSTTSPTTATRRW